VSEPERWQFGAGEDLPRSPSGRVPQWVIDESRGVHTPQEPWRAAPLPVDLPPEPERRSHWRAVVAVAVLVVALLVPLAFSGAHWDLRAMLGDEAPQLAPRPSDLPTSSIEESYLPLGTPETVSGTSTSYAFISFQADGVTPVAYDPCRPIHFVIRPDNEPEGGRDMIMDALYRVGRATGFVFVDDGEASEGFTQRRPARDPARYGDRWSPVLISWHTADENPDLADDVLGEGGSAWTGLRSGGPRILVSGTVSLDAAQFQTTLRRRGGEGIARAAILHELGHVVGLDHVDDPTQLMYPELQTSVVDFAAGDLAGLSVLGTGECAPGL